MSAASSASVRLRAMEPEDLDFLYNMENNPELWGVGNTNVPYSRYVLHDYIARASNDIYADGQVRLIVENGAHEAVGIVDVVNFDPRHRRAERSIAVEAKHRRCGYAAAAVAEIKDYAHRVLHLHQLYAVVSEANDASIGLFLGAGFTAVAKFPEWLLCGSGYCDAVMLQCVLP